ncbi:MAG: hypothetical protein HQL49_12005, partial [Gammaproteobacteria bacterium]|nr:hypothetical protein [Gammaproteobacteria bacterium]
MPMKLCPAGIHHYNPELYESCPNCQEDSEQRPPLSRDVTLAAGYQHRPPVEAEANQLSQTSAKTVLIDRGYLATPPQSAVTRNPFAEPAPAAISASSALKTRIIGREQPNNRVEESPLPVVGWLIIVKGAGQGRDYRLIQGENSIGRDPTMEICLDLG